MVPVGPPEWTFSKPTGVFHSCILISPRTQPVRWKGSADRLAPVFDDVSAVISALKGHSWR